MFLDKSKGLFCAYVFDDDHLPACQSRIKVMKFGIDLFYNISFEFPGVSVL